MVTRLYLSNTEASEVAPSFAGGWGETTGAASKSMNTALTTDALTTVAFTTTTPGTSRLHRQFVSPPMDAGNAFVTTDTFTVQVQGLESAANDNVINRMRNLRVVSKDGVTVQATLRGLGAALSVVEWNASLRNLTFAGAVVFTSNYTTVPGDRLVMELGHNDSAGLSISASLRWGRDSAGTGDLGTNETDLTTTLRPWLEISRTIVWDSTSFLPFNATSVS